MKSIRGRAIPLAFGASLLALTSPAPAAAQDASDDLAVDEIVVTAQKREENLQEVPLAVSAIGAERLEQLGVNDTRDLSALAPSLTVVQSTTSNSAAVISMRGITSPASESFGLDNANALYVDGVYIARSGAAAMDVMDLERVEVLRGPQGTLFGRNSTGGALALISRDPSEDFRLSTSATVGNFNQLGGRISIDTGRIGDIAASLSYATSDRDGLVDNILEPDDSRDPGSRSTEAFRAAFTIALSDAARFRYIYDQSTTEGTAYAFQLTNVADGTPRPPLSVNGQPAITLTQQAPVQQYLAASTFLEPGCAALATPQRAYRDTICLNSDGEARDVISGHNFLFEYDFDNFDFKSITGYRQWDSDTAGSDLDGMGTIQGRRFTNATLLNGMPAPLLALVPSVGPVFAPFVAAAPIPTTTQDLFSTTNQRTHEQFSQEFEFAGDTDRFDWVLGAFYFEERGGEVNPQNSGFVLDTNTALLNPLAAAAFGGAANAAALAAANPARYRLVVTNSVLRYDITAESLAFYGQGTWYVDGRDGDLSLTAGIRHTHDDKGIVRYQTGATPLAVPDRGDASFDRTTWSLMGRYEFSDDVNVYARIATGYRAGGFNAPDTAQAGNMVPFDPETLTSYELGFKSELFDRRLRLNAAVFHSNYQDFAVNVPVVTASPGIFGSRIVNAGEVTYTGAEIEGQAILSEVFSIDASIGYVDGETQELLIPTSGAVGAPIVDIASINNVGYTSEWTGNIALNAEFPTGIGDSRIIGRIGYTYESPKYSFANSISVPFNEQLRSDTVNNIDAQLSLTGISIGGAELEFRLWGRNLTDEHDFARGIDFGALGYAGGIYADPRMYGLTVTARY